MKRLFSWCANVSFQFSVCASIVCTLYKFFSNVFVSTIQHEHMAYGGKAECQMSTRLRIANPIASATQRLRMVSLNSVRVRATLLVNIYIYIYIHNSQRSRFQNMTMSKHSNPIKAIFESSATTCLMLDSCIKFDSHLTNI
jgi:hypothetical protein